MKYNHNISKLINEFGEWESSVVVTEDDIEVGKIIIISDAAVEDEILLEFKRRIIKIIEARSI